MRKIVTALSAAALLGSISLASAADITGTIKSVDATAKTVTLENGQVFKLGAGLDVTKYKAGDKVKITYSGTGDNMMAETIAPAT